MTWATARGVRRSHRHLRRSAGPRTPPRRDSRFVNLSLLPAGRSFGIEGGRARREVAGLFGVGSVRAQASRPPPAQPRPSLVRSNRRSPMSSYSPASSLQREAATEHFRARRPRAGTPGHSHGLDGSAGSRRAVEAQRRRPDHLPAHAAVQNAWLAARIERPWRAARSRHRRGRATRARRPVAGRLQAAPSWWWRAGRGRLPAIYAVAW